MTSGRLFAYNLFWACAMWALVVFTKLPSFFTAMAGAATFLAGASFGHWREERQWLTAMMQRDEDESDEARELAERLAAQARYDAAPWN